MSGFLIDTNVLSDYNRPGGPDVGVRHWLETTDRDSQYVSVITLAEIQKGIELHQRIDRFTDNHPVVQRSQDRLVGFQRYANPLIDVFYDHFLVMNWNRPVTVSEYVSELYRTIRQTQSLLPDDCNQIADRMMDQNWLNQYGTYSGLESNLGRMQARIEWATGRKVDLVSSLQILESHYFEFEKDFLEFWPTLKSEAETQDLP